MKLIKQLLLLDRCNMELDNFLNDLKNEKSREELLSVNEKSQNIKHFKKNMLMHIVKINLLKMSQSNVMKELKLLKLKLKVGKIYYQIQKKWY